MAYLYEIRANPYVTSILASMLFPECVHMSFWRSSKKASKSRYWSLLPCFNLRGR